MVAEPIMIFFTQYKDLFFSEHKQQQLKAKEKRHEMSGTEEKSRYVCICIFPFIYRIFTKLK